MQFCKLFSEMHGVKRGYIRPTQGYSEADQADAITRVGASMDSTWIEELSRRDRRTADPAKFEARKSAIRQLRKGDELVVASLSVVALNTADFINTVRAISVRGAALLDAEDGAEYEWSPAADAAMAGVAKFEAARLRRQTAPGRAALAKARTEGGFKKGRLPVLSQAKRAEAREMWADLSASAAAVAAHFGVSVRTLYNEFGPRTEVIVPRRRRERE